MEYYVRGFCTAEQAPTVAEIVDWLESREVRAKAEGVEGKALYVRTWERFALRYRAERMPLVLECHRNEGAPEDAGRREVDRFVQAIGLAGKSHIKRRILKHLQATKFVIAIQHPVEDMDDAGYDANGQLLTFLVERCGAIIQADREGFYERSNLVLPLEK